MCCNDRLSGDWVVPPEGFGSTGKNLTSRSKPHPHRLRPGGLPHKDSRCTRSTEQVVCGVWGTVHGTLSKMHDGSMLVLCDSQGVPPLRNM
jgi:hypothetical protein